MVDQDHFDRRMSELFQCFDAQNREIVGLKITQATLLQKLEEAAKENRALADRMDKFDQKQTELFHLRAFGQGLFMPVAVAGGFLAIGIGEFVKNYTDRWLNHLPH